MVILGFCFFLVSLVLKVEFLLVRGSKYVLVMFIVRVGLRVMVIAGGDCYVPVCFVLMLVVECLFVVIVMGVVMGCVGMVIGGEYRVGVVFPVVHVLL